MKKLLPVLILLFLSSLGFAQTSQTLSAGVPLWFTSTGTGTYNQTALYHSYTYGYKLELARTSDLLTANPIDFRITARGNGYNPFFIQGSTGNVGIGTTNPNAKLEILSNGSITQGAELRLQHANNNTNDIVSTVNFANNAGSVAKIEAGTVGANNSGYISMFTDNNGASSERMRITHDGYVGIGTTSPSAKLQIQGADIPLSGTASQFGGNLLIATNSPQGADIGGSIGFGGRYSNSSAVWTFASIKGAKDDNALGQGTGYMSFHTEYSGFSHERMRITSSGNVGIGTTSPSNRLQIGNNPAGWTGNDMVVSNGNGGGSNS